MSSTDENTAKRSQRYNLRERTSPPTCETSVRQSKATSSNAIEQKEHSKRTMEGKLDTIMNQLQNLQTLPDQIAALNDRLAAMEAEMKKVNGVCKDLAESVDFLDSEVANMKEKLKQKTGTDEFTALKEKVESMAKATHIKFENSENRSRRNNLIFHGVPERQYARSIDSIIKEDIMKGMMGVDVSSIVIERVHRTPTTFDNQDRRKPRPVHVRFLNYADRDKILRLAPSKLKGKKYQNASIFISDDVTFEVRELRKQLRQKLPEIKQRADVKNAVVPWSIPPSILIFKTDGSRQFLRDSIV